MYRGLWCGPACGLPGEWPTCAGEERTLCCWGTGTLQVQLDRVFFAVSPKSCVSNFLTDLLVVLVTVESGIVKPPIKIVELSIYPCIPVSFAPFTKLGVQLLDTYVFIIVVYSVVYCCIFVAFIMSVLFDIRTAMLALQGEAAVSQAWKGE